MKTLANKKIGVIGLGQTGLSVVSFLRGKCASLHGFDSRSSLSVTLDIPVSLGDFDGQVLSDFDMLVVSPGVAIATPAIAYAQQQGVELVGDVELFARANHKPVLAITGSNGKSTVTTLANHMLKAAGFKSLMGGNIGVSVLQLLEQDADVFVLELSSFQLETTRSLTPLAATVLNVTDDHLDRYRDFDHYRDVKLGIYQQAEHCIVNRDDANTACSQTEPALSFGLSASAEGFSFDAGTQTILFNQQPWLSMQECHLAGSHNAMNIQAAAALCLTLTNQHDALKQQARDFAGLAHRGQLVAEREGVRWINDSKATNIGSTVAAVNGLREQVKGKLVLIAGGDGKGADFSQLRDTLKQVDALITLGRDGGQIAALRPDSHQVNSLEQAVKCAAQLTQSGDTVLLSPACASLDMFSNYMQRGERFAAAVEQLA